MTSKDAMKEVFSTKAILKKTLIIVGIILLFLLLLIGWIWYLSQNNTTELRKSGELGFSEGKKTGLNLNEEECMLRGLERHKLDLHKTIISSSADNMYLLGCLETSNLSKNFCDTIPAYGITNITETAEWSSKMCLQRNMPDEYCGYLFMFTSQYCSSQKRAEKLLPNS